MKKFSLALATFFLWTQLALASSTTFDAAATKVQLTSVAAIEGTVVTTGCWTYRLGDGEGSESNIVSRLDETLFNTGWVIQDTNSLSTYKIYVGGWSTGDGQWDITRPSNNVWHHLAVAYDAGSTSNDPIFWVDGVTQSPTEALTPSGTYTSGTEQLVFGNGVDQTNTYNGRLASCFFYNRILTTVEVGTVMRKGPRCVPNGLVGYWPLGVFGGLNLTSTASLNATETLGSGSHNGDGPPVSIPQGGSCD